jgi:hypothetical protein
MEVRYINDILSIYVIYFRQNEPEVVLSRSIEKGVRFFPAAREKDCAEVLAGQRAVILATAGDPSEEPLLRRSKAREVLL